MPDSPKSSRKRTNEDRGASLARAETTTAKKAKTSTKKSAKDHELKDNAEEKSAAVATEAAAVATVAAAEGTGSSLAHKFKKYFFNVSADSPQPTP